MPTMIADRNAHALAILRISVGLLFLIFAEYKVFGSQFTRGGGFQFWINRFLAEGAYPFMVPILQNSSCLMRLPSRFSSRTVSWPLVSRW
jgi:hypothetical protein